MNKKIIFAIVGIISLIFLLSILTINFLQQNKTSLVNYECQVHSESIDKNYIQTRANESNQNSFLKLVEKKKNNNDFQYSAPVTLYNQYYASYIDDKETVKILGSNVYIYALDKNTIDKINFNEFLIRKVCGDIILDNYYKKVGDNNPVIINKEKLTQALKDLKYENEESKLKKILSESYPSTDFIISIYKKEFDDIKSLIN
jgi:hypothetical protein